MLSFLANKVKHLVFFIVSVFRRALCCFRRRRRSSFDAVPLTHVVSSHRDQAEDWNWDDRETEPKTVQDHIELYRKRKLEQQQHEAVVEAEDFFEDMAPNITRQTKLYISNMDRNENSTANNNRLNLIESVPVETGELREWEEGAGWEGETLDWDAQEALRQIKRQDRERKLWEQQQKRMEKGSRGLGARVNT